jgi:hypothetical protein
MFSVSSYDNIIIQETIKVKVLYRRIKMNDNLKNIISENVNVFSSPSELKITDIRVANINGAPKHCPLIKVYTNQGLVGYGEVRDASSATYALMLKSRLIGVNPCNVDKIFRRIRQFGGHSRQGGGVSGLELAMWDLAGKAWGVPLWQMLGGKFRDKVRVYCDTDVDGKHTGTDMGHALKARMEQGFTFLKMDLGIEHLLDEPGCLNAPIGMLEDIKKLDSMFEDAARTVITTGRASTSYLQTTLGMGFARAARVMSQLEAAGIVGPQDGKAKNREVLVQTFEELDRIIIAYTKS